MSRATPRSTVLRVAALRQLIEALGKGEVHRDDAKKLLKVSPSGIRAYFSTLVRNEIAEVAHREFGRSDRGSKLVYRLIADAGQIERFLATQGEPRKARAEAAPNIAPEPIAAPGRHFHLVMRGQTKINSGPVVPDPFALPAGFFSVGAGVEGRA